MGLAALACPLCWQSRTRRCCANSGIRAMRGCGLPSLACCAGNPVRECVAPIAESAQTGGAALAYQPRSNPAREGVAPTTESAQTGWAALACPLCWQSRMRRHCVNSGIRANGLGCPRLPVALAIPHEKALRQQRNPRKRVEGCPRLPVVLAIPHEKVLRQQRNPCNAEGGGCPRLPVVLAIPHEKVLRL
jgi:hypothetical protein